MFFYKHFSIILQQKQHLWVKTVTLLKYVLPLFAHCSVFVSDVMETTVNVGCG
jgi:hypothetical protein